MRTKSIVIVFSRKGKCASSHQYRCAKSNGQSLYMPAYVEGGEGALGVKIVSVYPENIKKNLPSVPATMIVLDPETGMVSACLDGTYLTQLRTGAVQEQQQNFLQKKMLKSAR